jgi:acylphosphatase
MKKQLHVFYSGMVQGVGFRFAAESLANNLNLTGWVKNLRDGRVEVVAEGEESALNEFLDKIMKRMQHYISGAGVSWQEATGEFSEFEIAFH